MPAFEYTALDPAGRERRGVLEGDTARQVRQLLREQQLLPVSVAEVAQTEATRSRGRLSLRRGISAGDLALLTRQLATLGRAGLPLEEALLAVSQQTEKPRVQAIVSGVRARVMEGRSLADGLAAFPQAFPEIYRATVSAGEQSGRLDGVLERLADYTENRQVLQSRIRNALVYPVLLTVVCVVIVSLLLGYVVPEVVNVFRTGKQQLPILTRGLIAISDGFRHWWWLIFGLVAACFYGFRRWLQDPAARRRWHLLVLSVPLLGRVVRGVNAARFARTLSILTASAVPVLEALRISGEVVGNLPMRDAVAEAAAKVREGAPIARSLGASKLYPPMLIHLVASGETSGELEAMLERAATNQEREMDGIVNTAVNILGPAMILVMGGFVLLIVLALLLPIFELNQLVR
ncbi:MAG TPA: type II secretion system inner membrane protein GspF [Steroidobacteraceae bacterium]|nr:type II secretion system inner membrane protein GspF [Steroidobacteraceae bacterium]